MGLKKLVGKRVQEYRKQKSYTQDKLAEMIGIDPKNVSKIEIGANYPSPETLTSIAKALEVDIYELFVFKQELSPDEMRSRIVSAITDDKTAFYLFQMLKVM